ncbi:MAG: hypothetical protein QM597_00205 [Aeromicrobium sp.]|uniref:hypothetical protein n=1 Tax=Aeromicrobium sp. TaxID=1871063 RepID=UPI0039E24347
MTVPVPHVRHSLHAVLTPEPINGRSSADFALPDESLLLRFGATSWLIGDLAKRPYTTILHRSGPVSAVRRDVVAARLEALTLGACHDGYVLDLVVPQIVPGDIDTMDAGASAQWVALDLDGPDVVSRGLETFGLPELRCRSVDRDALAATLAVLNGLTHRIITEWPENDPVGGATVTIADIAAGLGESESQDRRGLRVTISFTGDELLITLDDDPRTLFA